MTLQSELDAARALFLVLQEELAKLSKRAQAAPCIQAAQDLAHVCQGLRGEIKYLETSLAMEPDEIERDIDARVVEKMRGFAAKRNTMEAQHA